MSDQSAAILVVDRRNRLALFTPDGDGWSALPLHQNARWPAWNPVRDIIAVSVVEQRPDRIASEIQLLDLEGNLLRVAHAGAPGVGPVIAPRVPHYALWSPRGDVLSYVAQSSYGLSLFFSHADGLFVSDHIINGAPLFHSWCADNNFVALHAGPELAVVELEGSRSTAGVADRAIGFRTPAYSDDAEVLAYALPEAPGVAVMRARFQGTGSREVHRFPGGVALGFRPGTRELAVAVTRQPDTGTFDSLWLVDLAQEDAGTPEMVWRGPFAAFFWCPDGSKLALVVPTQTGDGRHSVVALSRGGRFIAATEGFVPSQDFRVAVSFFDQYSLSHPFWSPDSNSLVVTGRLVHDTVSASFGDPIGDFVMTWTVARGEPLRIVAPGDIGVHRPAQRPAVGGGAPPPT